MKSFNPPQYVPTGSLRVPPVSLDLEKLPARSVPTEADLHRTLVRLEWLSRILDEAITIPGTSIRVGWDAVIGLIPIVGDGTTTAISTYYIWEANRLGARKRVMLKMLGNVGIDFVAGTIPLVGDMVDVAWRANRRNLLALVRELEAQGRIPADSPLLQRLRRVPPPKVARGPQVRNYLSRPFMLP